ADGFDEVEAIVILSVLRRAGVYAKSVGLTSGLINGSHGILMMPDFALTELDRLVDINSIELIVLPGGERNLAKLEPDPRIHRLLRQVVAQRGFVATNTQGVQILKTALGLINIEEHGKNDHIILRYPLEQPVDQFAQSLMRRLERPSRA
ncbi:MAG: DJ-1/PfpI family protein, partial [Anaerolineae bacterium]|nr:DJ-1/PfpI family protein [Anaerolineae bacterium]